MSNKPTYEELEHRVKELEKESLERKRAEEALRESEERFRLTLEATRDGLWENNRDHKRDFFSDRMFTMLGYEPVDPAKGFDFLNSMRHPDDVKNFEKKYNAINKPDHNDYSVEMRLKAKDGTWRHILSRGKCVERDEKGKPARILGTHTDITDLKRVEEELRQYQEHLEEMVEKRTAELKRTNEQLQQEIAERNRAEEALRASEERFALAVRGSNDGIYDHDIVNDTIYWSPRLKEILGYADDELDLDLDTFDSLLHPDDKESTMGALEAHLKHRVPFDVEQRLRTKSGEYHWFRTRGEAVWDDEGQPIRMVGSTTDITERKCAEEALRESEERFRLTVEATRDGLWENSLDHKRDFFSDRMFTMLGYEPVDPANGFDFFISVMHPDDFETFEKEYNALNEPGHGDYSVKVRFKAKDGTWRHILSRGKCVERDEKGKPTRIVGTHTDITDLKRVEEQLRQYQEHLEEMVEERTSEIKRTNEQLEGEIGERRRAEEALRESEERFRLTVEATRDGLWENSLGHKGDFFNDRFFTMLGYEPMDHAGGFDFFKTLMHPDDSYEKEYNALNEPGHDEYSVEFRLKAKDGTWRHILSRGKCIERDDEGKPTRIVGTHTDITERKRADEALQREKHSVQRLAEEREAVAKIGRIIGSTLEIEEVYKHFAEEVRKIIPFDRIAISLVYPEKGTFLTAHITGKEVPGYRSGDVASLAGTLTEETVRKRSSQLIQTEDRDEVAKRFPSLLPSFQAGLRSFIALPLISKDQVIGVLHVFSARLKAYTEADVELAESIGSQIAGAVANAQLYEETKRAEEKIEDTNRKLTKEMREKEEFLRVVSHDLGAPVRNISGMAASIIRKYEQNVGDDVRDRLARIQRNAEHELGLIQDLLELSRIKTRRERSEEVDLAALVKGVEDGLSHQLEEKGVTFKVAEELPVIVCERKRVMQVFQNLIDNACKYMDSNGGPRIEVGFEELEDSYRFSVSDNGIGIKEEDQERIFYVFNRLRNPTTSRVEGKGVGLSAVKAIVEAYGGEVWVESPPKDTRKGRKARGSTFYFTLAKDMLRGRNG